MVSSIVGLDVGGANLKASDGHEWAASEPFPLYQDPDGLASAIAKLLDGRTPSLAALTMSGELADCFESRREGVAAIVEATRQAVDCPVVVWQTAGEFVAPDEAKEFWSLTAAANWHALASFASRCVAGEQRGLLIDCGTTTIDIVPLANGCVLADGLNDAERSHAGELVYSGVGRTPVMAICHEPIRAERRDGQPIILRPAAEVFATSGDIHRVAFDNPTIAADCPTADGRSPSLEHSRRRLARQLLVEEGDLATPIAVIAQQLLSLQERLVLGAAQQVTSSIVPDVIIVSGSGESFARRIAERLAASASIVSLTGAIGPTQATAACAYSAAVLAAERLA